MHPSGPYELRMGCARRASRRPAPDTAARAFRGVLGLVFVPMLLALSTEARAEAPSRGAEFELRVGTAFAAMRAMPSLRLSDDSVLPSRGALEGKMKTAGGFRVFGGYFDSTLTVRPRLSVPLFGLGFYVPVGDHAPVNSALDGSVATLEPWRMFAVDVLGPGIGLRATHRRWFFEGSLRFALLLIGGKSTVASGREAVSVEVLGAAPGARAEISVCRRLDPTSRVCLAFAPRLYEVEPLSGASLSLSWVWGN